VYFTVLHRLFATGSDRAADLWKENYAIPGAVDLALHHLYRTMAWLGEEIGPGALGAPRCIKDEIEEAAFDRGRDLFSQVGLVFFDKKKSRTPTQTLNQSPASVGVHDFCDSSKIFRGCHKVPNCE